MGIAERFGAGMAVAAAMLCLAPAALAPGCRSATPVLLASASEARATVNRITPFPFRLA